MSDRAEILRRLAAPTGHPDASGCPAERKTKYISDIDAVRVSKTMSRIYGGLAVRQQALGTSPAHFVATPAKAGEITRAEGINAVRGIANAPLPGV